MGASERRNRGFGLDRGVEPRGNRWQVSVAANGERFSATFDNPVVAYARALEVRQERRLSSRSTRGREAAPMVEYLRHDPCAYCGAKGEALDHIEPVKLGGDSTYANLTGSCVSCNYSKSDMPLLLFLARRNGCWEWRQTGVQSYEQRAGWQARGAGRSH